MPVGGNIPMMLVHPPWTWWWRDQTRNGRMTNTSRLFWNWKFISPLPSGNSCSSQRRRRTTSEEEEERLQQQQHGIKPTFRLAHLVSSTSSCPFPWLSLPPQPTRLLLPYGLQRRPSDQFPLRRLLLLFPERKWRWLSVRLGRLSRGWTPTTRKRRRRRKPNAKRRRITTRSISSRLMRAVAATQWIRQSVTSRRRLWTSATSPCKLCPAIG